MDVMISERSQDSELRIAHALWLRGKPRLGRRAVEKILGASAGFGFWEASVVYEEHHLIALLGAVASAAILVLSARYSDSPALALGERVEGLRRHIDKTIAEVLRQEGLAGTIKERLALPSRDAVAAAASTLADLLDGPSREEIHEAWVTHQRPVA